MPQKPLDDYVKNSMNSIETLASDTGLFGQCIETAGGVCIIPVSEVKIAFASGSLDFSAKKNLQSQNNGGGGGTLVTVTPIAYLTVSPNGQTDFIPVRSEKRDRAVDKITDVIENAPTILQKIKNVFS